MGGVQLGRAGACGWWDRRAAPPATPAPLVLCGLVGRRKSAVTTPPPAIPTRVGVESGAVPEHREAPSAGASAPSRTR